MTIRHWIVPSKTNKFQPLALRPLGLMVFLALFITIPMIYNITSARQMQVLGYAISISVDEINSLSNNERINAGLPALNIDSQLTSAAQAKANDMFADDYWAHIAPDGATPWSFINASGYDYQVAGENLAKGFNTSAGVVSGWMASQVHKENILNSSYKDVGYAVVNGVLLGSETTLVVAMYATRVTPPTPQIAATEPAATPTPKKVAPVQTSTSQPVASEPTPKQIAPAPTSTKAAPQGITNDEPKVPATEPGAVEGANIIMQPIETYQSFNWGQKASIVLICTMLLLFIMKHTLIWRAQRRGYRQIWLRSHPIGQASLLVVTLVLTIFSGAGTIL